MSHVSERLSFSLPELRSMNWRFEKYDDGVHVETESIWKEPSTHLLEEVRSQKQSRYRPGVAQRVPGS